MLLVSAVYFFHYLKYALNLFLQRHPKNIDLTKTELLKLLSCLEGELQARDVSIAALKVMQLQFAEC